MTEEEFYTVLLLLGPMMLQVAALLLLVPGRCSSKFVGEGGSGDVRPLSHAALLQLLL